VRGSIVKTRSRAKRWTIAGAVVLFLGLAGLIGAAGCGEDDEATLTTVASGADKQRLTEAGAPSADEAAHEPEMSATGGLDQAVSGTLGALQATTDQKIIANAQLDIEVEKGEFNKAFNLALLLADRYEGYVLSSNSYAGGDEDTLRSGTVALRIPFGSFDRAVSEASELGELKSQSVWTDDVTEEYVDIESNIRHTQAVVDEILGLLDKAKTLDEILRIQQTLAPWQAQLEQLNGRLRYLDEHTSYSTLTLNIYEAGVEVAPPSEWGFVQALKDALHHLVDAFSAIVRGLGWLVPILVIVGVVVYIFYLIYRAVTRRSRGRAETPQPQQQEPAAQPGARAEQKDKKEDKTS